MSMSKQDYEMLAEELVRADDLNEAVFRLAYTLAKKNPRFDANKFILAAGVPIVEEDFSYNQYGMILDPGKFENEMWYMPKAYQQYKQGLTKEIPNPEDEDHFFIQAMIVVRNVEVRVSFWEDNVGFVHEVDYEVVI